ncbi:hypothetical protein OG21DRAFT_1502349 [Imleria badia]|nr:hypothetical protein OG21DRAFT_1502349 [Imleria badia]
MRSARELSEVAVFLLQLVQSSPHGAETNGHKPLVSLDACRPSTCSFSGRVDCEGPARPHSSPSPIQDRAYGFRPTAHTLVIMIIHL